MWQSGSQLVLQHPQQIHMERLQLLWRFPYRRCSVELGTVISGRVVGFSCWAAGMLLKACGSYCWAAWMSLMPAVSSLEAAVMSSKAAGMSSITAKRVKLAWCVGWLDVRAGNIECTSTCTVIPRCRLWHCGEHKLSVHG